ncbi:MAG TPA: PilZ domain-containing protein [Vicinamibacterales bacterium]|nr:PilZ domain-containing protein [Vicinamibacterales bacterium]
MNTESAGLPARIEIATDDRRESDRVSGPFDAWRLSVLETPVRIYDISLGGCFVNAMHEQVQGIVVTLRIQMPGEGWLELKAETIYRRPGFGFAVRFVDMTDELNRRLERALGTLRDGGPH